MASIWMVKNDEADRMSNANPYSVPRRLYYFAMAQMKAVLCASPLPEISIVLSPTIANDLLEGFDLDRNLTDKCLALFSKEYCDLDSVNIQSQKLTGNGLRILGQHIFKSIRFHRVNVCLGTIIDDSILSPHTQACCISLRVSFCDESIETSPVFRKIALMFKNLQSLELRDVGMQDLGLVELCQNLSTSIVALDISLNRKLTDISPIRLSKENLKIFKMHGLTKVTNDNLTGLIADLKRLTHLDASLCGRLLGEAAMIFLKQDCLKYIVSLDITSRFSIIHLGDVRDFINSHPNIEFIGLAWTPHLTNNRWRNWQGWFRDSGFDVTIDDNGTEEKILLALHHYKDDEIYSEMLIKQLMHLFEPEGADKRYPSVPRYDIISVLLYAMQEHPQHAATLASLKCLRCLIRGDVINQYHPNCLSDIAMRLIHCIGCNITILPKPRIFRLYFICQVAKGALKILTDEKILHETTFDFIYCVKVILRLLLCLDGRANDVTAIIVGVRIIEKLITKIDVAARQKLTTQTNMAVIVRMISQCAFEFPPSSTMIELFKCLYYLTEDSPSACDSLIKLGGVELILQCLTAYTTTGGSDDDKKMPVLYNAAAVLNQLVDDESKKYLLINTGILPIVRESLRTPDQIYKCICSGIASNLMTGTKNVRCHRPDLDELNSILMQVIPTWYQNSPIYPFTGFKRFIPLFAENTYMAPRLWALWTMEHMTRQEPQKYVHQLWSEDIRPLWELSLGEENHPEIQNIAYKIRVILLQRTDFFQLF